MRFILDNCPRFRYKPKNLAHRRTPSARGYSRKRSECGARGRNDTLRSRAASENTPGRHYDRSARSSLDWDRRLFAHDLSNHRDHALRHVPGSACPELSGGVRSPKQEPRWNADRRARCDQRAPHPKVRTVGFTCLSAFRLPFSFVIASEAKRSSSV
jgi:hypothetical protein